MVRVGAIFITGLLVLAPASWAAEEAPEATHESGPELHAADGSNTTPGRAPSADNRVGENDFKFLRENFLLSHDFAKEYADFITNKTDADSGKNLAELMLSVKDVTSEKELEDEWKRILEISKKGAEEFCKDGQTDGAKCKLYTRMTWALDRSINKKWEDKEPPTKEFKEAFDAQWADKKATGKEFKEQSEKALDPTKTKAERDAAKAALAAKKFDRDSMIGRGIAGTEFEKDGKSLVDSGRLLRTASAEDPEGRLFVNFKKGDETTSVFVGNARERNEADKAKFANWAAKGIAADQTLNQAGVKWGDQKWAEAKKVYKPVDKGSLEAVTKTTDGKWEFPAATDPAPVPTGPAAGGSGSAGAGATAPAAGTVPAVEMVRRITVANQQNGACIKCHVAGGAASPVSATEKHGKVFLVKDGEEIPLTEDRMGQVNMGGTAQHLAAKNTLLEWAKQLRK